MQSKIRIGIAGYGNLGRGVEMAIAQSPDMQLVGVFTRRDPASIQLLDASVPVHPLDDIERFQQQIDVLILCGGSKNDLPEQGPALAALFNTVDSFDTHATIPEYHAALDQAARPAGKTAMLSVGWDPGLFSLNRLYGEAILPVGATYTFWGKGLSQGHSDAVRRVPGVKHGVQYTIPSQEAIERVRSGELPELSTGKSTSVNATWCWLTGRMPPRWSRRSSACRTTLPTTTPQSPSSRKKSCAVIMPPCPMVAW